MKKIVALVLALAMVFSLAACGSSGSKSAPEKSTQAPKAVSAENIKVGAIMVGDENEGYSAAHIKALDEMKKALGLKDDQVIVKTNIGEDQSC